MFEYGKFLLVLVVCSAALLAVGCGGEEPPTHYIGDGGTTDTDTDTDTDADTDSDTDSDSEVDECEEGLDDCDENATCTDTPDGYECDCNDGYTGDGFDCELITVLNLSFWEMYWEAAGYEQHDLLIGPDTSSDPDDGSWTVLADGAAMLNAAADNAWARGAVIDISAWSGQDVRIAFHYQGTNADKWYVEDICIGFAPPGEEPTVCDTEAGFDNTTPPALPPAWSSEDGNGNFDILNNWRTSTDQFISSPTSAVIDNSLPLTFSNKYLVSLVITLP